MRALAELSLPDPVVAAASPDQARAPERDDHAMILAARQGDRASMRAIYEAEAPSLVRRLRHLTGDLGLAPSLSTWLYGIALNKWRNDQRKRWP